MARADVPGMQPNDIRRTDMTPEQLGRYKAAMNEAQLRANSIVGRYGSRCPCPTIHHFLRPTLSDTYCGLTQAEAIAKGEFAVPTAPPWRWGGPVCQTCGSADFTDHSVDDAINALVSWINLETTWPAFKLLVMRIERDYPGTCRKCGGPAYIGINDVDCRNKCSQ